MQKEVTFVLIFSPLQGITNMSNLDQFINKLWQEVHIATSHLTAEDKEDIITTLKESVPSWFLLAASLVMLVLVLV